MRFVSLCLSAVAVLTAACESSMIHKTQRFSSDQSLVTSADLRVVHKINADNYVGGRFRPTTITCAEPSPDIAKAVSASFDLAGSFGLGGLPSNIKPEAAAAISLARAEGMAQLTQRLATIQLLRDGLYRACEAFANGAISDTAYAILLSRLDDTMVTMLLGELAAGNFSGRQAAIGTGAGGSASAELSEDARRLVRFSNQLADASGADTPQPQDNTDQQTSEIPDQQSETARNASKRSSAQTVANTLLLVPSENTGFRQDPKIAENLVTMQRKYIENINLDSMVVACVTALDTGRIDKDLIDFAKERDQAKETYRLAPSSINKVRYETANAHYDSAALKQLKSPLAIYCYNDVLPAVAKHNTMVLEHILAKSRAEKQFMEARSASLALQQHMDAVYDLLDNQKVRELSLIGLQERRAALPKERQSAKEQHEALKAEIAKQKMVVELSQTALDDLKHIWRELEVAAIMKAKDADLLRSRYEAAEKAEKLARKKAKKDKKAADEKGEDKLKEIAEQSEKDATEAAEKAVAAKSEYDAMLEESKITRANADSAKGREDKAKAKLQEARKKLADLEAEAGILQGRLDALKAEAGQLRLGAS